MTIAWDNALSVGHSRIDSEHRSLIAIIRKVEMAIATGAEREVIGNILCDLSDYCAHHFDQEEREMMRCRYGGYQQHKGQHDDLIQHLSELVYRFEARQAGLTADTLTFLTVWLTEHILVEDKRLALILGGVPKMAVAAR